MEQEEKNPMEEALDRIEPYDERQREKIEKLKERFRSSAERRVGSVARIRKYIESPPVTVDEETKALMHDGAEISQSLFDGLAVAFEEQSEIIGNIAEKMRER